MSNIDINGIDKPWLLMKLFNASFNFDKETRYEAHKDGITALQAKKFLEDNGPVFDVFKGRPLFVDLSGNAFDPAKYDIYNGQGKARQIVAAIREQLAPQSPFRPAFVGRHTTAPAPAPSS